VGTVATSSILRHTRTERRWATGHKAPHSADGGVNRGAHVDAPIDGSCATPKRRSRWKQAEATVPAIDTDLPLGAGAG
jgi:hypothetical protein